MIDFCVSVTAAKRLRRGWNASLFHWNQNVANVNMIDIGVLGMGKTTRSYEVRSLSAAKD
jgi:hypothetical protein